MTYKEYRKIIESHTNDFVSNYCFVAFGNQFDNALNEYLQKFDLTLEQLKNDNIKLSQIVSGVYCLKKFFLEIYKPMAEQHRELFKKEIESNKENLIKAFIYELNNHEFNYTNDPTDAIYSLGYDLKDIEASQYLTDCLTSAMNQAQADPFF